MVAATKNQKATTAKGQSVLLSPHLSVVNVQHPEWSFQYSWLPDVLRVKGSIIPRIFGPVFTVTIFSVIVAFARSQGNRIELTNSVVPLLSVVVGLILVFSTSYDRYWEGRRCFSTLTGNVRNLSRLVWVHVALPPTENDMANTKARTPTSQLTHAEVKRRKIETLRYCLGFVYAVKHYLRGEDGAGHDDMAGVLPPHFSSHGDLGYTTNHGHPSVLSYAATQGSTSDSDRRSLDATKRVKRKRSKKNAGPQAHTPGSTTPLLSDSHQTIEFHAYADHISMPLPLIIAHEITSAIFNVQTGRVVGDSWPCRVQSMVDQMTCMERIANSPIPSSYGIHLKQCVTLYLFALPLTLMNDLGWRTIPIVTVVAFTLMGIEGIADEIEMPFGEHTPGILSYLTWPDTYCDDLKEEVEYIIERLAEGGHGTNEFDDGEGDD
ncbi:Bestrophin, RFP-TM, chloride channel-domain-containing protein [Lanmaoa asiatica]|nr:Bestrophin, RFP-TM, chloride channel-domain-containing protein [Lanmaoa asiatica]